MTKPRNPRKLLGRIAQILWGTAASVSLHPKKGDPLWRDAATIAFGDVCDVVAQHFPDHAH